MPRRYQTTFTKAPRRVVACIGDSLTYNTGYTAATGTVLPHLFWPERLATQLRALGAGCKARNFGISGNTSWNLLDRFACLFQFEIPDVALIWIGGNDPGAVTTLTSLTGAGTTATATTPNPHHLTAGASVTISGASPAGYNGTVTVASTPTATTFTYAVGSGLSSPATGTITYPSPIGGSQTTLNLRTMIRWLNNASVCKGYAIDPSNLPANGLYGDRWVVQSDTSTTGGNNPTVAGAIAAGTPTVWEFRTTAPGVAGWGRVSDLGDVAKIAVGVPHYLNYSGAGDTPDGTGGHAGQDATSAAVDAAIRAAATAEGVPVCDIYEYLQARINGGYDAAGSGSWHVQPTNQHLNPYGQELVARAFLACIQAQAGWIPAISW